MRGSQRERAARVEQIKRWIEEVARLTDTSDLPDEEEGTAFTVEKDRQGLPGEVVIVVKHALRTEHWRRSTKGWFVSKTEYAQ